MPFITGTTLNTSRNDFSGWLGMRFTVGAAPISVTQLGRLWLSGNSLAHALKLVDASTRADVPNGSVSLAMAGAQASLSTEACPARSRSRRIPAIIWSVRKLPGVTNGLTTIRL